MQITNAVGNGDGLGITSSNRALVAGITEGMRENASLIGHQFNINSGIISLTSSSDNAILYFKNDESPENGESRYLIESVVVGIGDFNGATLVEEVHIKVLRNPTAGTIISGASAVDMNSNSNFGASETLSTTTLAYKGASGNTFTDGTDHAIIFASASTTLGAANRAVVTMDIILGRGNSIGITVDPQTTTAGNVYAALIGYKVDGTLGH